MVVELSVETNRHETLAMKTAQLSDISIAYQEAGGGDEVLLLVHGFPLDHTMWSGQLAALSDEFRVVAPDLRGFGQTPLSASDEQDPQAIVTMRQYADDLAELLDVLAITEPINFCGLSMGGYIAWQFVQQFRQRLKRLILCDTKAAADSAEAADNRHKVAEKVLLHGSEFLAEALMIKLISDGTATKFPETAARIRQMILNAPPESVAAAQRGMAARPDMSDILPQLDLPTLVLVGSDDAISPPSEMRGIADALPQAEFIEIAGAGHMCPMERPDKVNAALREFLRRPV